MHISKIYNMYAVSNLRFIYIYGKKNFALVYERKLNWFIIQRTPIF